MTTLIHINQYNTDKQNLDKKMEILIKNSWRYLFSVFNTEISEAENKMLGTCGLLTTTVLQNWTIWE